MERSSWMDHQRRTRHHPWNLPSFDGEPTIEDRTGCDDAVDELDAFVEVAPSVTSEECPLLQNLLLVVVVAVGVDVDSNGSGSD